MNINKDTIGAIVLAAGQSRRMGVNKLLMPWQGTTIIQHILEQLHAAHIHPIVMVIGKKIIELIRLLLKTGFSPSLILILLMGPCCILSK